MKDKIVNKRRKGKVHVVTKIKSNKQTQNQAMLQRDKTLNLKLCSELPKSQGKKIRNRYCNSFGLIKGITSTDQETFPDP